MKKSVHAWIAVIIYSLTIFMNWSYIYEAVGLKNIIINSWSILFPLFNCFYLTFSLLCVIGIFYRKTWGFGLGLITILSGAMGCMNSYIIIRHVYPLAHEFFALILIFDFCTAMYLWRYTLRHKMQD